MSNTSKRECIDAIRDRYRLASKRGKQRILDEVCQVLRLQSQVRHSFVKWTATWRTTTIAPSARTVSTVHSSRYSSLPQASLEGKQPGMWQTSQSHDPLVAPL
jgi:hypothetical protein